MNYSPERYMRTQRIQKLQAYIERYERTHSLPYERAELAKLLREEQKK